MEEDMLQDPEMAEGDQNRNESMANGSGFRTTGIRSLSLENERLQEPANIEPRLNFGVPEDSIGINETHGDAILNNEPEDTASTMLLDDLSTEIPSASSQRIHSQISGDETDSTRLDAKTRWAFLDEDRRDDSDANAELASHDFEDLALDTVQRPEVPPSIMEQVNIIASQHPESLTEEQYQNFLKHPRERQRQSVRVVLNNLAGLGPWFGVKRRMSQEENMIGV